MGNLGAYQDFVVKAKDAGGVERLIEGIEKSAALKAMPKGFAAGVAATLAIAAAVQQYSKRSKAYEAEASRAKATLTADIGEAIGTGVAEVDELTGEDSGDLEGRS